jgi:hypothetical protein
MANAVIRKQVCILICLSMFHSKALGLQIEPDRRAPWTSNTVKTYILDDHPWRPDYILNLVEFESLTV